MTLEASSMNGVLPRRRVVRRVLAADPSLEYYVYVPGTGGHDAPLFVAMHGISRNAREQAKAFVSHCERAGAVLVAPLFAADKHPDYQRLGRAGFGPRADAALNDILEEVTRLTGAGATQIYLFGHSGGAQFAHRYIMACPHRVARAVIASSGWYTLPDDRQRFPYGIRRTRKLPGVRFDPEEFLRVPIKVLVGAQDTASAGLRQTARVAPQGKTRIDRARNWVEAMRNAASAYRLEPLVTLEVIPDGVHSFARLIEHHRFGDKVFEALFGSSASRAPSRVPSRVNGHK